MRRLYLHIYLTFVAILLIFGLLASVAWYFSPRDPDYNRALDGLGSLLSDSLPGPEQPHGEVRAALGRLAERFSAHLALHDKSGMPIASVGDPLPAPDPNKSNSGWLASRGRGPTVAIRLLDGRWLVARHVREHGHFGLVATLIILALAIAVGAYPVARRITKRLERLQNRVEQLGAGELSARVRVEGKDEVANLARSFNHAADRIERLVNAQRTLLASASHELRSPLARMRVAIELLGEDARPEIRARVAKDIGELDELIEELLLASRLDALEGLEQTETVDLLALLAEEAARSHARVSGDPLSIRGDRRLLRRLVRNLLENARHHGGETSVEASVVNSGDHGALIRVADRGPGVPENERERIFEAFYRPTGMRESGDRGVGLGLALVRQIARHHGGEARCIAREGGGTCFEVSLQSQS